METCESPKVPEMKTDGRVALWFFSWLVGMFLFSGGFVLLIFGNPSVMRFVEKNGWVILVSVAAALVCLIVAAAPWYVGICCRRCRSRLWRMPVESDKATGNAPLRFHCKVCDVVWETHLVSGPGDPRSTA